MVRKRKHVGSTDFDQEEEDMVDSVGEFTTFDAGGLLRRHEVSRLGGNDFWEFLSTCGIRKSLSNGEFREKTS